MSKIGEGLWFELDLDDKKFKQKIDEVKRQVTGLSGSFDLKINSSKLEKDISDSMRKAVNNVPVTVSTDKLTTSFQNAIATALKRSVKVTADPATLTDSIKTILNGTTFPIKVKADKVSLTGEVEEAKKATKELNQELNNQSSAVDKLKQAFLGYFTISAAKDFLSQIIQIGGEIQKQRMAMASIVGDGALADQLYGKLRDLSMISPFSVEEIVKYTKQLSAFGIQYNDLYDTAKRLADVAAGTGVDFSRIAYEYGQTSARGWLDARELRMFANSGIPLLKKLSDYYSKMRGVTVTSSQVRGMITNREVSFADVKEVIRQMTDEGGEFYNMQEVMAESLAGKWRNLANAWNIMLSDMADSGVGNLLKDIATALTEVTKSWSSLSKVIAVSGGVFLAARSYLDLVRVGSISMVRGLQGSANDIRNHTAGWRKALEGFKVYAARAWASISKIFMANWPVIAFTAAAAALTTLYNKWSSYYSNLDKLQEDFNKRSREGLRNLTEGVDEANSFDVASASSSQLQERIKVLKDEVKKYDPIWQDTFNKIFAYDENTGKYNKTLIEQYTALVDKVKELKKTYEEMDAEDTSMGFGVKDLVATTGNFWIGDDNFTENVKEAADAYQKAKEAIAKINATMGYDESAKELIRLMDALEKFNLKGEDEVSKAMLENWKSIRSEIEKSSDNVKNWQKFLDFMANSNGLVLRFGNQWGINGVFANLGDKMKDVKRDANTIAQSIFNVLRNEYNLSKDLKLGTKELGETLEQLFKDNPTLKNGIAMKINAAMGDFNVPPVLENAIKDNIWTKQFVVQMDLVDNTKELAPLPNDYQNNILKQLPEVQEFTKVTDEMTGEVITYQNKLTAYQKAVLAIRKAVMENTDDISLYEVAEKMKNDAEKSQKHYAEALKKSEGMTDDAYENAKNMWEGSKDYKKYIDELWGNLAPFAGFNFDKKKGSGSGLIQDKELNDLKKQFQRLKYIWDDYQMYLQRFGSDSAWKKVQNSDLWSSVIGTGVELTPEQYKERVQQLQGQVDDLIKGMDPSDKNYEARKTFWASFFKDILTIENDVAKPAIDAALAQAEKILAEEKEKYNYNLSLFELTGNSANGKSFVETLKELIKPMLKDESMDPTALIGVGPDQLKEAIKDPEFKKAIEKYVDALHSAIIDEQKKKENYIVEGVKMSQSDYQKVAALNAQFAKMMGLNVADNYTGLLTIPDGSSEEVQKLYTAYRYLFAEVYSGYSRLGKLGVSKLGGKAIQSMTYKELNEQIKSLLSSLDSVRVSEYDEQGLPKMFEYWSESAQQWIPATKTQIDELKSSLADFLKMGTINPFSSLINGIKTVRLGKKTNDQDLLDAGQSQVAGSMKVITDVLANVASKFGDVGKGISDGLGELSGIITVTSNFKEDDEASQMAVLTNFFDILTKIFDGFMEMVIKPYSEADILAKKMTALGSSVDALKEEIQKTYNSNVANLNYESAMAALKLQEKTAQDTIYKSGFAMEIMKGFSLYTDEVNKAMEIIGSSYRTNGDLKNLNFYDLGAAEWEALQKYAPDFWSSFIAYLETSQKGSASLDAANTLAGLNKQYQDLRNQWLEAFTKISFDSMYDNFVDMLKDMESSAEDFADNFSEMMMNAVLNNFVGNQLAGKLQDLYNKMGDVMSSGNISKETVDALRAEYDAIVQEGLKLRDLAADITGYTGESSESGLTSSIKGVTEETANILAAYMNAIRADVSVQRTIMESIGYEQLPQLNAIAESQLSQLNMIQENTRLSAEYAEICAGYAEQTYNTLNAVTTGTKKIAIQ